MVADICPKTDSPPPHPTGNQWGKRFYRQKRGEGYMQKQQPALTVIFQLVTSGLTSIILTVLGTVNLQFQGPFVPISLRQILRIVAASVMVQSGHQIVNFFHLVFWYL